MRDKLDEEVYKQLGYPYKFASVNEKKLRELTEEEFVLHVKMKVDHLKTIKSKPYYWIVQGHARDLEEAERIVAMKKPTVCPTCSTVYDKTLVKKIAKHLGCTVECQIQTEKTFKERLSKSRSSYNVWDPVQYAEYNSISVEEANTFIEERKRFGSIRKSGYWEKQGLSEEEALQEVRRRQAINSPRSTLYWTERGFTETEAKVKVTEHQSNNGIRFHQAIKDRGSVLYGARHWQYYVNKGLAETEEEAREIVKEGSRKGSRKYWDNTTVEQQRIDRPRHIEYWQYRYPDDYAEKFEAWCKTRYHSPRCRSIIADEFCLALASYFEGDKLYHTEKEYGKYIPNEGYRLYDFVNLSKMICVEFHGNYWHKLDCPRDASKKRFIEEQGFLYFVIWESEYKNNRDSCVENLYNQIMEAYNKRRAGT